MSEPTRGEQNADYLNLADLLSPEDATSAQVIIDCMEEGLGIERNHVRLTRIDDSQSMAHVYAVDASPNGQHIGRYAQIVERRKADPRWYMLNILGITVDPLRNMTEVVYRAMIRDAQLRGESTMPDSVELSHLNKVPWTATMLTGEPLTEEGFIPIASYSSDKVDVVGFNPNRGGVSIRVRAAVYITQLG